MHKCLLGLLMVWLMVFSAAAQSAEQSDALWVGSLQAHYFNDREIAPNSDVLTLEAPIRAEDGAVVPIKISAAFPQSEDRYIKTISVFIDRNPVPLAGNFHFTQASGRADLDLRIRVNEYSDVRAVAETNDGKLHMVSRYVKASGGCSAPAGTDMSAAMARLGKMRLRFDGDIAASQPLATRLAISHPNLTGLQKNQITQLYIPAHFIENIVVKNGDQVVFSADVGISISENPNFQFYFVPQGSESLTAEITDSKGGKYTRELQLGG